MLWEDRSALDALRLGTRKTWADTVGRVSKTSHTDDRGFESPATPSRDRVAGDFRYNGMVFGLVVLGGELAVPYTRNPLYAGRNSLPRFAA